MKKEDLSEFLTSLIQKLSETKSVDVRHDQLLTRPAVLKLLDVSYPTLQSAIEEGEFPPPILVAGKHRWPTSLINEHIRICNPCLQGKNKLVSGIEQELKGLKL